MQTGSTVTFTAGYNGLDTRAWKVEGGVGNGFTRAGAGVNDPVLRDSNAVYTPGISERRGSTTTFLHSGLKDATAQSSTSQVLTASRVYDAFGMVVSSTGTWKGPFGYAGSAGHQEDATGLQLLGHRYYDPSTGRFLTRDPAKDGRNWYGYCDNAPIRAVDPEGLNPWIKALKKNWFKEAQEWIGSWGDALKDTRDFLTGDNGGHQENGEGTRRSESMKHSALGNSITSAIESGRENGHTAIGTVDAFRETVKAPWNGTQAQVGAAAAEWERISDSEIKVTVRNKIGLNSLVYHITHDRLRIPDFPVGSGPLGDYYQEFEWYY